MTAALIDAHVHVWDPAVLRYPWLDGLPALDHLILPPRAQGSSTVFVQADCLAAQALDEVAWVEALSWPALRAIVAHAPLELGDRASGQLEVLAAEHPLVHGIRRLLQDEGEGRIESEPFLAGLHRTARLGFSFDATVRSDQLAELARAHAAVPGLAIVLDHLGNPPIPAGLDSDEGRAWREGLRAVAANPDAVVKLSGAAAATHAGAAFLHAALEAFGPERSLLGSDSPLSVPDDPGAYRAWAERAGSGLGLGGTELEQLRHRTAERVYRLAA